MPNLKTGVDFRSQFWKSVWKMTWCVRNRVRIWYPLLVPSVSTLCLTQCDSLLRSLGCAPEFMLKHSSVQFFLILGCRVLPYLENSTKEGEVEQLHSDKEERWQSWCRKNWKVNCWFVFAVKIDQWACADSDSLIYFCYIKQISVMCY